MLALSPGAVADDILANVIQLAECLLWWIKFCAFLF